MQAELAAAHVQIHRSEGRLRDTVANLTELENSVRRSFGPSSWTDGPAVAPAKAVAAPAAAAAATAAPEAAVQQRPRPRPAAPAPPAQRTAEPRSGGRAGLASRGKPGLAIPEQLKDYWFPVEFSASLVADRMVPFELFGEVGGRCCLLLFCSSFCTCLAVAAELLFVTVCSSCCARGAAAAVPLVATAPAGLLGVLARF